MENDRTTSQYDPMYEPQIEALMARDFDKFYRLVGAPEKPQYRNFRQAINCAWMTTGSYPNSLFASLPNSESCASTIESPHSSKSHHYAPLFGLDNPHTPHLAGFLRYVLSPESLRPVLEEFARRQTLARAHPCPPTDPTPPTAPTPPPPEN